MVMEKSRCREEEPPKEDVKLVLAPQMGWGIMPNTVRESGNPVGILMKTGYSLSSVMFLCIQLPCWQCML